MAKFTTPFGFSAEGFVPGGEAGLEAFSALPGHEQKFIRDTGRSPTLQERETGVYDVTPRDLFAPNIFAPQPGTEYRFNMPVSPPMLEFENNTYQTGLSPEIEARIQQDANRGLFDVNERSVAQLGLQASPEHLAAGTLSSLPGQIREPSFRRWPLRVDPSVRIPRRTIAPLRPLLGKGGLTGLGLAAGLYSGGLSEGKGIPFREEYYTDPQGNRIPTGKTEDILFTDEDSPFRQQLPHTLFPPNYLNEMAGRSAAEGVAEGTRQDIGSAWDVAKRFFRDYLPARRPDPYVPDAPIWDPSKEQVPLGTPEELYKERNDLEEMRFRGASIPPDFRVNETSMASLSPTPNVIFNPPPISRKQEIENMMTQDRIEQLPYLPGGSLYKARFEQGTGPMESQVSQALFDAAYDRPVQEELQSLAQLSQTDPGIAKRYVPGSQALQDITCQVESFEGTPGTTWTQSVPDISDILKTYVPPPAAPEPYVEQFEEITPPKKVVKKKVKKAKPGPKKEKVKAKVSKAPPRRVKYTPPKPKPAPRRVKYTPPEDPFAFEDRRGGRR